MFLNRTDAGRQLAQALHGHPRVSPVVIGVVRGGVPVAAEIARELALPLDLCVVRRLLAPTDPPVPFGAVAESDAIYLDETREHRLSARDIVTEIARERAEVARLCELLRDRPALDLTGRDVIVVDDAATSIDMLRAAARSMRKRGARSLELAIPVASSQVLADLHTDYERITCLVEDYLLVAIGARSSDFYPVSEAEVVQAVREIARRPRYEAC